MNRRTLAALDGAEKQTLLQMYRFHPKSRIRERAHIALLSSEGFCVKQIAQVVHRSQNTVSTWLSHFQTHGFLGLYDEPIPGRSPRLNPEQMQQLDTWMANVPRDAGYQQSNWTLKLVRHAMWKTYRVQLSKSRIAQLVHHLGFSRIRPRHRSIVPTKEQIAQAMACIAGWLEKAEAGEVRLFYLDETLAMLWATLSVGWARRGSRPEVPMGDDHRRLSVIAAADPLRGRVHYRVIPTVNQKGIVAFLKQLRRRYPGEELVFILDNAKPHIAASVKALVAADGRMKLEYLPRYTSVKCNPIERLFKWFRRVVTHNHYFENLAALKRAIQAFFRSVVNLPKRVISLLGQGAAENLNSLVESL